METSPGVLLTSAMAMVVDVDGLWFVVKSEAECWRNNRLSP